VIQSARESFDKSFADKQVEMERAVQDALQRAEEKSTKQMDDLSNKLRQQEIKISILQKDQVEAAALAKKHELELAQYRARELLKSPGEGPLLQQMKQLQQQITEHQEREQNLQNQITVLERQLKEASLFQPKQSESVEARAREQEAAARRQLEIKNEELVKTLQAAGINAEKSSCNEPACNAVASRQNGRPASLAAIDNRIAVIGYSCILPGGENVNESWDTIRNGLDCLSELPADRVDVTAYFHPDKTVPDKIYCTRGGFIPDFELNPRDYNLNMLQMEDTDVNQIISLIKVKECLDDAKLDSTGKKGRQNIGCVLGIGGGQKASHEFYSRLNYVVVEKVLRKMGVPEQDVAAAVEKYKAHFPEWRLDSFPGFLGNVTSGRVSNVFDLDGMNCVVDAACASSLIAVKVAIDEILHGDAKTMIAGATCTDCSIGMFMAFSKTPVFSRQPSVTAYDKDTGGMLIGEGSVMFVLKKLADAEADGDTIHCVIRGVASSSDGAAPGIYAPTIDGQATAIRRAYANAGVDPATVTLIEGHGTGTPVGDRIELTGLARVLGQDNSNVPLSPGEEKFTPSPEEVKRKERVAVGSIKSNIGHLKAVAGCAGMMKVILALKHKVLPSSINVNNPPLLKDNSRIQDSPLYINTRQRPWFTRNNLPRRAGVSSFGFGGANYHCVIEEYVKEYKTGDAPYRVHALPQPILIHAATSIILVRSIESELKALKSALQPADVKSKTGTPDKRAVYNSFSKFWKKFALQGPVPAGNARLGFVAITLDQTIAALTAAVKTLNNPKFGDKATWSLPKECVSFRQRANASQSVAALFSGQGSQYTYMFEDVAMNWPCFRDAVSKMNSASEAVCPACQLPSEVLYPRAPYKNEPAIDENIIANTLYSQPAIVACSIGAFNIFSNAGLKPDYTAGHSLGELSALHAAGVMDLKQTCEIVCHRAQIMASMSTSEHKGGVMAAVIGNGADSIQLLQQNVWKANINSPSQVVISGGAMEVHQESKRLASGFKIVPLKVSEAFHTPFMQEAASRFEQILRNNSNVLRAPSTNVFSNVTGQPYPTSSSAIVDILSKHMISSVRFVEQIQAMYAAGARIFVEFGPKGTLSQFVQKILGDSQDVVVISVNSSTEKSADLQLRQAAVDLAVAGVPLTNFDPWGLPNPHLADPEGVDAKELAKARKGMISMSAATYVAARTKANKDKLLNDGYKISGKVVSGGGASVEELERTKIMLAEAQRVAKEAQMKVAETSDRVDQLTRELNTLKRTPAAAPVLSVASATPIKAQIHSAPIAGLPQIIPNHTAALPSTGLVGYRGPNPPPEYMKWGQPKGSPSTLSWHPLAGKNGNPTPGFQPTAFPPRAITFFPFPNNPKDTNHIPGVLPLSWVNLCEFMCNKVSLCLGDEFKRFDDSTTSRSPAFDLQLVTRVLEVKNLEVGRPRQFFNLVDTNPSKGTMIAEFDCPADAWFFKGGSNDALMPYSILMEIGLQTSGILTSWVKAPLTMNLTIFFFVIWMQPLN